MKRLPAALVAVAAAAAVVAGAAAVRVSGPAPGVAAASPPAVAVLAPAAELHAGASPPRPFFGGAASAPVFAGAPSAGAAPAAAPLFPDGPPADSAPAPAAGPSPAGPSAEETVSVAAAEHRAAAAAAVEAVLPEFYDRAQELFARSGVPGAALAVVAGDRAVYVDCFGVREAGRPGRVGERTVFQLASVSKGFTATMLAALVTRHELAWDDPVRAYWPGFALRDPWVSDHATFRDLMAMRSGLPEYAGDELRAFGYGRAEIVHRLRHLRPVAGFRAAYAYQNSLPTAAAMAASRATGRTWTGLVQRLVLDPLRMESTVLTYRAYLDAPDHSASHVLVDGVMRPQTPEDDDVFAPAGAVSSTIADLVPYLRLQLDGGALDGRLVASEEALAATHAPVTVTGEDDGGTLAYGMGWKTRTYQGRRVVEHGGDYTRGVSTLVSFVPDDGVGIAVLTNAFPAGHALAAALKLTLYDLYMTGSVQEDWLAVEQDELTAALGPKDGSPAQPPEERPRDARPPRPRAVYGGVYVNDYYGRVRVSPGPGASLRVRLGRGDVLRYVPWDGDTWRQPGSGTEAVFTVRGGTAVSVRLGLLDLDGRDGRFTRR